MSAPANPPSWRTRGRLLARRVRVPLGFLFAAFFLLCAHPSGRSLAVSLALVLPGLALRAYASGYVKKNAELTTTGPYAYTRNPLYLGSMLMAFGFAAASRSLLITAVLAVLFVLIYLPVIRGEEEFLRSHFPGFAAYARTVPRLLPRLRVRPQGSVKGGTSGSFSRALYGKHREYNALIGAAALYVALLMKPVLEHHFRH
jgi:protein-S-isoprenylcysteine O-methyltransferase Ste14